MNTECKTESIQFHALGSREVRGQFDGGDISTDAGGYPCCYEKQKNGRGF